MIDSFCTQIYDNSYIFFLLSRSRETRCVMRCAQKYMDSTKEIGKCFADGQETKILGNSSIDIPSA